MQLDGKMILDLELGENDIAAKTVREYIKELLLTLLVEREDFNSKRPFGNSGWVYVLEEAFCNADFIPNGAHFTDIWCAAIAALD